MRVKSIAVFLIVLVLMILFSLWQVDSAFYTEQKSQGEGAARAQLASIVPGLQAEFRSLGEHVKLLASLTVDRGVTEFNDSVSYRVEMIARLHPKESGEFVFDSKSFNDKTTVRNWAENYTTIALKALKPKDVVADGAALVSLPDPQRKPFFLWIFRDEKERWTAVITKPSALQNLMDRQKGLYGTAIVVNHKGQVLGHTTSEYVGTSMVDDPVVSEIMKSGRRTSSGLYKDPSGQMAQGYFEIVPASNTYVVLSRPLGALKKSRDEIRWQLILLGGGFLFIGLAAFVYVNRGEARGTPSRAPGSGVQPKPTPGLANSGGPPLAPVTKPSESKTASADGSELLKERMKAYTTSASALARELHGPIARIMGLTRVLIGRDISTDSKIEVLEIEELARASRSILRKLLSFAGEEEYQVVPTGMNESLNQLLTGLESKFKSKGIQVEKNFKRVSQVKGNSVGIARCLEAILLNSIESMERMPVKKIILDLDGDQHWVSFKVRDTGEGIPSENVNKVFDPFFSSKNRSIHSGLGLSMALGVIHEFGGDIEVTSEAGKGTLVEVRLPVHPDGVKADTKEPSIRIEPPAIMKNHGTPGVQIALPVESDVVVAAEDAGDRTMVTNSQLIPKDLLKAPPQKEVKAPAKVVPIGMAATPKNPAPAAAAARSPAPKSSLLHERAIQDTLDAIDNLDEPAGKKIVPPPPPRAGEHTALHVDVSELDQFVEKKLTEKSSPPPVRGNEHSLSVKIDRPQIAVNPSKPKVASAEVSIRKPGERPGPGSGGRR